MVVQLDKKNYEAWFDYGDTLFELGYLKEALKALNRCIEINQQFAEAYYTRAKVLFVMKKMLDAVDSLKSAFALHSDLRKRFETEFLGVKSIKEFSSLLQR
jgi:tetratricopeptide (TPR) repeat protein